MSGRVEQWLHRSERTPNRTVDERMAELLAGSEECGLIGFASQVDQSPAAAPYPLGLSLLS